MAWERFAEDGINDSIWANYYDGTNWNTAELLDTGTGEAWDPQIAFDADGHAIAIWTQYENDIQSIWTNSFQ